MSSNFGFIDSGLILFVSVVWALFVTFAWLFIAYRAMVAHERIARSLDEIARTPPPVK